MRVTNGKAENKNEDDHQNTLPRCGDLRYGAIAESRPERQKDRRNEGSGRGGRRIWDDAIEYPYFAWDPKGSWSMKSNLHEALQVHLGNIDTYEIEGNASIALSSKAKDNCTSFDLENGAWLVESVEPCVLEAERIQLLVRYNFVDAYNE